ncbi:LysR family transcriptional regulator [Pannonibacter sp. Q-1]|uniref:HTH-type transcriptional activator CmpR n=2 Tax=Pannonibacter phragmitetus TaxID=121719 RepID=A0A0L0J6D8_9HYPH|nr:MULTISPECIES: LysR family transcriptional regulator [Pannonibacter]ALV29752.1 LysR family transcriptional regulator [Pannonibacter phragmitetus]KND21034.1 LysR family transcriptional regulator [Pannonibacter phragmitetus]SUB00113.1 HTH-type transcriptional activator CmpR [Pannonibacter phragmitetus]
MKELTLRQVEVIRAVMMAGTIAGAAKLLNVSAPGVSRLIKYTEDSLGVRLFERKAGLFVPVPEAQKVFDMVHQVYRQMENLNQAVSSLHKGEEFTLSIACAPSIAQFIAARAIRNVRQRFPDLFIDLNILKIEETLDYLLLERGEFVIMSSAMDNPAVDCQKLVEGRLVAVVPEGHRLAEKPVISVHDLMEEPIIGIDESDPYGRILSHPYRDAGLEPRFSMRGRFAQTIVSLVRHGLGVSVIDEFSVAEVYMPGLVRRPLKEPASINAWVLTKHGRQLSSFAEFTVERFRHELQRARAREAWDPAPSATGTG